MIEKAEALLSKPEKAETKTGSLLLEAANQGPKPNLDSDNGISTKELEEISKSLNDNIGDVVKLGHIAKGLKNVDHSAQKTEHKPTFKKECLASDDLTWAIADIQKQMLAPIEKKPDPVKPSLTEELDTGLKKFLPNTEVYRDANTNFVEADNKLYDTSGFTSQDWQRIRTAMQARENDNAILPDISLVEHIGGVEVKKSDRGVHTIDRENDVATLTEDGKTTARLGKDVVITREDDHTKYESQGRTIYERLGDNHIARLDDATTFDFEGGKGTIFKDGKPWASLDMHGIVQERRNAVIIGLRAARTAEEALEEAKVIKDLDSVEKSVILTRPNGLSIVRDGKLVADFDKGEGEGRPPEATFYINENKKLVRTSDGKLLIREKGKDDIELKKEQIEYLISKLGDNAKFISRTLRALEMGESIVVSDQISLNVSGNIQGRVRNSPEPKEDLHFTVDGQHLTTSENGTTSRYDTKSGSLDLQLESGKTASITPGKDHIDLKTEDLEIKDGRVTFADSKAVIERDGTIDLGNGSSIKANGDVHLADGSIIKAYGQDITNGRQALNQPTEKSLEVYMNFAKALASSVAGRAHSGSVSLSDIAMLRANLSIIGNYIGFFSQLGNMEIVNSLSASWALVKSSLDQAEPRVKEKQDAISRFGKRN